MSIQSESCAGVKQKAPASGLTGCVSGGVCAETTSRFGRDEEDRAAARKRLTFHGVAIMTPVDGVVSRLTDGIKAVIDAHQLEDLKVMIRCGMAGVIRDGRHAGGHTYGYRTVPGLPSVKGKRESGRGKLEIVDAEAAIVRRIFAEYIAGATPRAIAGRLNAEGVPPPRGCLLASVDHQLPHAAQDRHPAMRTLLRAGDLESRLSRPRP